MKAIAEYTKGLSDRQTISLEDYAQMRCDWYNESDGNLPYIKCDICKNKGYIAKLDSEQNEKRIECVCMKKRRSVRNLELSGLGNMIRRYTFKAYETPEPWQEEVKAKATRFVEASDGSWFFTSGQTGCGKSHICTAICTKLLAAGREVKYYIWRNLFHELQSTQFSDTEYRSKLKKICDADVLYVDDFLKSNSKNSNFDNELNFAFEIINSRYNSDKKTIISSELLISDIEKHDAALAGRIAEKSAGYITQIQQDSNKNYRLR